MKQNAHYQLIHADVQIWKFCLYGFFKNLKFFEPYLLIYLMGLGYNLFQIGIFFSVREGLTYLFEVPSGILADHYGKKKVLLLCFMFYIVSFVFFFIGSDYVLILIGMIFFGLGEAFRSGTHKAMILTYLEHKGWFEHKGYVYGRTRAYSLLGSSVSAFLSIILVLNLPSLRWVFLVSIVPYLVDFLLIVSYPALLDDQQDNVFSIRNFFEMSLTQLKAIFLNKQVVKIVTSAASYDGVFKTVKDYIQPIMGTLLVSAGAVTLWQLDVDSSLKVYLGIIYGVFYIFSSFASKNVYRLTRRYQSIKVFGWLYDAMAVLFIALSVVISRGNYVLAVFIYFVLYIMMDARRPVFVDVSSDYMEKHQRVTVLSVESQLRALLMVVIAPLFGWLADAYSIHALFLGIGIALLVINRFFVRIPTLE